MQEQNNITQRFLAKTALMICSLLLIVIAANAQTVKGKITDDENLGVPGASVSLQGSKLVVMSDSLGNYSINIPSQTVNPVLVVSMLGFVKQEIMVNKRPFINVKLVKEAFGCYVYTIRE